MMKRVILLGVLIVVMIVGFAVPASAWTASNLTKLYIAEDWFWNYDFVSTSAVNGNVDWPVDMLFWNDAEVDYIKGWYISMGGWQNPFSSSCFEQANDGSGAFWDDDRGVKSVGLHTCHMRLYAPGGSDRFYNTSWGYWVLGTCHYDYMEFAGGWCGKSEAAEHEAATVADLFAGVVEDQQTFYNYEPYHEETKPGDSCEHIWDNNGLVTTAYIP